MKALAIATLSVCLLSSISHAQSTLHVHVKTCHSQTVTPVFLNEFKIFKADSLVKTIKPDISSTETVKNVAYGLYEIEYKTKFQQLHRVKIELSEPKEYHIDLCMYYIDYENASHKPFIDQLKDGEFYSIHISSSGCFHSSSDSLVVKRQKGLYYVLFKDQKVLLATEDITAIRHFEIELSYMESSGCTSVDRYTLEYKQQTLKIRDGSCRWFGSYRLMEKLKLIDE